MGRTAKIKNMVCHTITYFTCIYFTFVTFKLFFTASDRQNILLPTIFAGDQVKNISIITLQNFLNVLFTLCRKAKKVSRNY